MDLESILACVRHFAEQYTYETQQVSASSYGSENFLSSSCMSQKSASIHWFHIF